MRININIFILYSLEINARVVCAVVFIGATKEINYYQFLCICIYINIYNIRQQHPIHRAYNKYISFQRQTFQNQKKKKYPDFKLFCVVRAWFSSFLSVSLKKSVGECVCKFCVLFGSRTSTIIAYQLLNQLPFKSKSEFGVLVCVCAIFLSKEKNKKN